jgi:hypothetical protein
VGGELAARRAAARASRDFGEADRLRAEQYEHFRGETWLREMLNQNRLEPLAA